MDANANTRIKKTVMRRVYMIRAGRLLLSTGTLSMLVFVLALWGIGREVWVARVFENMPQSGDVLAIGRFYLAAFENTRIVVQVLTLVSAAALVYLARQTARVFSRAVTPAYA